MIVIFTTLNKKDKALKIGMGLLRAKLIACFNLFPVTSAYWWKGKIISEKETMMILKTKVQNYKKIESYIKKHSDYEIPEVVTVKPSQVSKPYLKWIEKESA